MKANTVQTIFLLIAATALVFMILGFLLVPKANAGTLPPENRCMMKGSLATFSWTNWESEWDEDWEDEWDTDRSEPVFRYNRVEGLHLGMKLKRDYQKLNHPHQSFLFGSFGYSFAAKEFQYQAGLEKGVMNDFRLALGGEYHRLIDTPDRWIIGDIENSLAAVLLREDFQDFYIREGGSVYMEQHLTKHADVQLSYHYDQLDSIEKNTNWAVFGGKKKFRPNPKMNAGHLKSVQISVNMDTRNSKKHTTQGWWITVEGEHSLDDAESDFQFDRVLADIRRYQPLGYGEGLDFRIRAGSVTSLPPWQRTFHLGGLSTLRGFRYKAFPSGPMNPGGNRLLLGQVELRLGSETVSQAMDLEIFDLNRFVLFADAGWVGVVDPGMDLLEGFDGLGWKDFKSDVGIALTNNDGNVRFEIARRTDISRKPFTFLIRIKRDF
ncbi:BamA/TamA family outer membrane protein [bacterium]|nr:BamA/TamA family outer membrane protein [bacterium]